MEIYFMADKQPPMTAERLDYIERESQTQVWCDLLWGLELVTEVRRLQARVAELVAERDRALSAVAVLRDALEACELYLNDRMPLTGRLIEALSKARSTLHDTGAIAKRHNDKMKWEGANAVERLWMGKYNTTIYQVLEMYRVELEGEEHTLAATTFEERTSGRDKR